MKVVDGGEDRGMEDVLLYSPSQIHSRLSLPCVAEREVQGRNRGRLFVVVPSSLSPLSNTLSNPLSILSYSLVFLFLSGRNGCSDCSRESECGCVVML